MEFENYKRGSCETKPLFFNLKQNQLIQLNIRIQKSHEANHLYSNNRRPLLYQVFFGASDMQLDVEDVVYPQEVDTEMLGSGAVMAFTIITPLMLLAYAVEGRKNVQVQYIEI